MITSDTLKQLRRRLHQLPELSGQEVATAAYLADFLRQFKPTELLCELGGTGVAARYAAPREGPTVVIRCELDALPIAEVNTFAHRSSHAGVSHKCGHDGHMAIVAGLAPWLEQHPPQCGNVILLFQPAEETGRGAAALLDDARFRALAPDYFFALHNIPGYPLHEVLLLERQFNATVQSLAVNLQGLGSHAAEPERGRNPAMALAELLTRAATLTVADSRAPDFALITPVHARLGQRDYGISAGEAELHFTLRSWTEARMQTVVAALEEALRLTTQQHGLTYTHEWLEYFPTVVNDDTCNAYIRQAAQAAGLPLQVRAEPFKFGEDFGWFTRHYPGAMFGLGAGREQPALHHPDYDFPDELIESGLAMFRGIISQICSID